MLKKAASISIALVALAGCGDEPQILFNANTELPGNGLVRRTPVPAPIVRPFQCAPRQQLPGQQPGANYHSPSIFGPNTALVRNTGGFGGLDELHVYYAGADGLLNSGDPGEGMVTVMPATLDPLTGPEIGANHIVWTSYSSTGGRTIWLYDMGDGIPGNNDPLEAGPFLIETDFVAIGPRLQGDLLSWSTLSNTAIITKVCDVTLIRGTPGSCVTGQFTVIDPAPNRSGMAFRNGAQDVFVAATRAGRPTWDVIQSRDSGVTWQPLLVSNAFDYGNPTDTAFDGYVLVGERFDVSRNRGEGYLAYTGAIARALPAGIDEPRLGQVPPSGQLDLLVAFRQPNGIGVVKGDFSTNIPNALLRAPSNEFYAGHDIYGDTVVWDSTNSTSVTIYYSVCD